MSLTYICNIKAILNTISKKKIYYFSILGICNVLFYLTSKAQGVSDPLERIFRKHNIATAVKPHQTLRQTLVHPKDKKTLNEQSGIVYKIPCKDCDQVYIGETGRPFSVRKREHLKDVQDFEKLPYTRSSRKQSHNEQNKSAITDHVASTNHSIDWDSSTAVAREDNRLRRWIRESIHIQMEAGNTMNRDRGQYQLTRSYNPILKSVRTGVAHNH